MGNTIVSVVITTRNRSSLLVRSINSVRTQIYPHLEIIVVDDASSDNTAEVMQSLLQLDHRIIYIKNDVCLGANASRNKGILSARGDFVAGLDDDDEFLPNRIEILLKQYDPEYAFVTSNNLLDYGSHQRPTQIPEVVKLKDMLRDNVLCNQALVSRSRIIETGLYDTKLKACQDYDMWMRLIQRFGNVKVVHNITQVIHMSNDSNRISTHSKTKFSGYFNFYRKYKHLMDEKIRRLHLFRIYDIRSSQEGVNQLPRKFLFKQIDNLKPGSLCIFGTGEFMRSIYGGLRSRNIEIKLFVDSNPKVQYLFDIPVVTPDEALEAGETCFLIASVEYCKEMIDTLQHLADVKNRSICIVA
ncbi:MAG: glycosyltransferase [Deltaproteobacteria bacterium]|nr:glycosyltransferase [Deltaproteobacteria bacterium]